MAATVPWREGLLNEICALGAILFYFIFFTPFEILKEKNQICAGSEEEQAGRGLEMGKSHPLRVPELRQAAAGAPASPFPARKT